MRKKYPECKTHPFSPYIEYSGKQLKHDSPPTDNTLVSTLSDIEPSRKRDLLIDAARNGNNRAIWMIAAGYQSGWWGFPVDKKLALHWYNILVGSWKKDAEYGDAEAKELLNFLDGLKKE